MEVSDADRELFEDIKAWLKDGHHEGVCPGMIAEFRQKAISTQAAELDALRGEVERLTGENFLLAAGACINPNGIGLMGDEHGNSFCEVERERIKLDEQVTDLMATIAQLRDRVVALEEIPSHIAEQVLSMGRAEWGATSEKTSTEHLADLENTLRLTREKFNLEDIPVQMHGLYLEGAETVLCHTGTSPNSGANAQALVGAWNWLYDQCKARALLTQNEVG